MHHAYLSAGKGNSLNFGDGRRDGRVKVRDGRMFALKRSLRKVTQQRLALLPHSEVERQCKSPVSFRDHS